MSAEQDTTSHRQWTWPLLCLKEPATLFVAIEAEDVQMNPTSPKRTYDKPDLQLRGNLAQKAGDPTPPAPTTSVTVN